MTGFFFFFFCIFIQTTFRSLTTGQITPDVCSRLEASGSDGRSGSNITSWCQRGNNNTRGPASWGPDMRVGGPAIDIDFKRENCKGCGDFMLISLIVCRPCRGLLAVLLIPAVF